MANRQDRYSKHAHAPQSAHERRAGESALSEFADYVQKQQALRRPPGHAPAVLEDHDELSILDELGLSDDTKPHIRLKSLFTDSAEDNVTALADHIKQRLAEGHGEVLFDVGLEDNGDSMGFSKEAWEFALERINTEAR